MVRDLETKLTKLVLDDAGIAIAIDIDFGGEVNGLDFSYHER